jgi:predicted secreted protein
MKWTSVVAIYALFWVMSAFILLPFGVKTHDEAGIPKIPGQADSAPANFRPGRVAIRATILAAVLCALYVANYINGWIRPQDLNFFGEPPAS